MIRPDPMLDEGDLAMLETQFTKPSKTAELISRLVTEVRWYREENRKLEMWRRFGAEEAP